MLVGRLSQVFGNDFKKLNFFLQVKRYAIRVKLVYFNRFFHSRSYKAKFIGEGLTHNTSIIVEIGT